MTAEKRYANNAQFRHFRCELFHASLSIILSPLRASLLKPEITRCPDGHFGRVIYGLGPYIANYMEQIVVTAIVQNWCDVSFLFSFTWYSADLGYY